MGSLIKIWKTMQIPDGAKVGRNGTCGVIFTKSIRCGTWSERISRYDFMPDKYTRFQEKFQR